MNDKIKGFICSPKFLKKHGIIYDLSLGFQTIDMVKIQGKYKMKTRIKTHTVLKS